MVFLVVLPIKVHISLFLLDSTPLEPRKENVDNPQQGLDIDAVLVGQRQVSSHSVSLFSSEMDGMGICL